jgi:hypothetical protein
MRRSLIIYGLLLLCVAGVTATETIVETPEHVTIDQQFNVNITCLPSEPVKGWEFKIRYNKTLLYPVTMAEGDFFYGYDTFPHLGIIDYTNGTIINIYNLIIGKTGNTSSPGTLVTIRFKALSTGNASICLYDVGVCNETKYLNNTIINGSIYILPMVTEPPEENETQPPPDETPPPEEPDETPPSEEPDEQIPPDEIPEIPEEEPPIDAQPVKNPLQAFGTLIICLAFVYMAMTVLSRRQ